MKVNSLQEKRKRKKGHVWLSSKPAHEEQRQQGILSLWSMKEG